MGELYSKTHIDELVLSACCEQMFENDRPFTLDAQMWLFTLERLMLARPSVIHAVLRGGGGGGSLAGSLSLQD